MESRRGKVCRLAPVWLMRLVTAASAPSSRPEADRSTMTGPDSHSYSHLVPISATVPQASDALPPD
jgi:hypothetical protein